MNTYYEYKGIQFKRYGCIINNKEQYEIPYRQINLYVVLGRNCNANCSFCEYCNSESNINLNKFEETIKWLNNICKIGTVHITGGEPTLDLNLLKAILKIVKTTDNLITTSVNTNGIHLKELEDIEGLDNIALSRHAITDIENYEIFKTNSVPSTETLIQFKNKNKLHLSCNLIKGYIDNEEKIRQYLEFAANIGVIDIGLVSLMQVNKFCKIHYVEMPILTLDNRLIKNKEHYSLNCDTKEIECKCENYLYLANNMKIISMYHRHAIKNNCIADYLVYDNNIIKQGFSGKEIILT